MQRKIRWTHGIKIKNLDGHMAKNWTLVEI